MDLASVFLKEVVIRREFYNGYYVAMAIIMALAIYLAYNYKLVKFSGLLWLSSGTICLIWEGVLLLSGARHYNFFASLELLYHALTEAGPGLIIMAVAMDRWGIVSLEHLKDSSPKKQKEPSVDRTSEEADDHELP